MNVRRIAFIMTFIIVKFKATDDNPFEYILRSSRWRSIEFGSFFTPSIPSDESFVFYIINFAAKNCRFNSINHSS